MQFLSWQRNFNLFVFFISKSEQNIVDKQVIVSQDKKNSITFTHQNDKLQSIWKKKRSAKIWLQSSSYFPGAYVVIFL